MSIRYKNFFLLFLHFLLIIILIYPASINAEPRSPYAIETGKDKIIEKGANKASDKETALKRDAWIESYRGAYGKTGAHFYFSGLYTDLGRIASERAVFDEKARPKEVNQIITDPAYPNISQQRLLSNITYDSNSRPINYKEEIFITANDYLTNSIIRLLSTEEIFKIQYNDEGRPINILGNTEVVVSDDKGNTLLNIKGSFTKRAKCDINGKVVGYYRYGIDNIVVAGGAGEIIVTAPPSLTEGAEANDYR